MIELDEDALICDFAETYNIYDMRAHPADYIAKLAVGLREGSRIRSKANGMSIGVDTLILAHIADNTALNVWMQSKDGQKGRNRPKRMVDILLHNDKKSDLQTFKNGEEFMKKWRSLTHGS